MDPINLLAISPCILSSISGQIGYLVFEATGIPDDGNAQTLLGGNDASDFTAGPPVALSLANWYYSQLIGTVVPSGDDFGPFIFFDPDLTITITCDGTDSNTLIVPAIILNPID